MSRTLAKMIRGGKVHAISCTAANLEEDVFNLIGGNDYVSVPRYTDLSAEDEWKLLQQGLNRVADTCIPENVFRRLEKYFLELCLESERIESSWYPAEIFFEMFRRGWLQSEFQTPVEHSWLMAAWEQNIPVFTPGFEDSTLGTILRLKLSNRKLKAIG